MTMLFQRRSSFLLLVLTTILLLVAGQVTEFSRLRQQPDRRRRRRRTQGNSYDYKSGDEEKRGGGKGKGGKKGKGGGKNKRGGKGGKKEKGGKSMMSGKGKGGKNKSMMGGGKGKGRKKSMMGDERKSSAGTEEKQKRGGRSKSGPKDNQDDRPDEYPRPPAELSSTDMGYRFSKVPFLSGMPLHGHLPLRAADYPITPETASWLKESQIHSLVIDDTCLDCPMPIADLVEYLGGPPSYPSSDPEDVYWDELMHVVWAQEQRKRGVDPASIMPLPMAWEGYTVEQVTAAVHNEIPGTNHLVLLERFMAEGATIDQNVIPFRCRVEFLNGIVMLADINTWAPAVVGPMNFGVKYYAGRPRPEEIIYLIANQTLTAADGVPPDLIDMVDDMDLERPEDFTAYPEGCPLHPSWPAMHSAASSASLWMAVVMNLNPQQSCQVKLMDYAVAYARTVAGVHYRTDNEAGLTLGQELIAQYLPDYLAQRYGSDPEAVRTKIAQSRFDWTDFEKSHCARHGTDEPPEEENDNGEQ